jgi:hypothetical protein
MAFQCTDIGFLPDGLAWVKDAGYNGGKVFYFGDYIVRLEKGLQQAFFTSSHLYGVPFRAR